ncbi:MAG: hypothetical protein QOI27_524 [Gaiellaceae bacterium]|nr:hypothetical protein [Gaiellaceae bacterium]
MSVPRPARDYGAEDPTGSAFGIARPHPRLRGRQRESAILAQLLDGVRAGRSGALVVRGEEGVG